MSPLGLGLKTYWPLTLTLSPRPPGLLPASGSARRPSSIDALFYLTIFHSWQHPLKDMQIRKSNEFVSQRTAFNQHNKYRPSLAAYDNSSWRRKCRREI